jgi:5,6,7,8-tetrahydromethanopterin hydro-lyase
VSPPKRSQRDDIGDFAVVGVFIRGQASDNRSIYDYNCGATKEAVERAMKGLPNVDAVVSQGQTAKHPLA